jgi:zinc protease
MRAADRTRLPQPGPEPPFVFPGAVRSRLRNGLSVWTLQRGTLPLVSVVLLLPAGAWFDPDEKPGLASFTADMLDEGTEHLSAIEIQEALARLGGELDTDAGYDAVTVSMTLLQRHLGQGLRLLSDLVCRPRLSDADVARVRALRLNRLRQMRDVPAALAERVFSEALYGTTPYGHLPFGATASLECLTQADVAAFHAVAYRPDAVTIVIVGPTSSEEASAAVEAAFGDWKNQGREPVPAGREGVAPAAAPARVVLVDRPGAAQTELRIGHVAVARQTPDYHALLVLNAVLGGQFVSRLNLILREQKGYTYGARTAFEFRHQPGPFSLATSVQTDATADAVASSLDEIGAIRERRPVTADELRMAQRTLTLGYPRGFESSDQIARALSQLVLHRLPDDTFAVFSPRIREQTIDSVRVAAGAHLDPDRLAIVAVGDVTRIRAGLEGLGLGQISLANPIL